MASEPVPVRGRDEPALIGRDEQVEVLEREIERITIGSLRVALVTGAAGLGKTRLVGEVVGRHGSRLTVLSARAYRWGATTSLGPWIEAVDRYYHSSRDVHRDHLRELADSLVGSAAVGELSARERIGRLDALVELLDRLVADRPVAVVLDDIHLADASSWEALRYVARRLEDAPIGVFATARPAQLRQDPLAQEVLVGLADDGVLVRVPLPPLSRPEIATLAHDVLRADPEARSTFVPEPLVTWLLERSLGHPLFVISLLRALIREGADLADPGLERIPEGLRDRVALELGNLDDDERALLDLLTVLDLRVSPPDLTEISDRSSAEVAAALEHLTAAQLVAEHGSGADLRYEVAHPIIQDTVYERIGGARQQELHRAVARTLQDAGRLGSAAAHFARAAEPGDGEAIDALCRAVDEAQAGGLYREVLAVLEALLEVLPAGDERWLRVLDTMDWQSEWVLSHLAEGDADIAIRAIERIADLLAARGDVGARATVEFHRAAFLSFGAGRIDEAERACLSAIDLFRSAGDLEGELTARNELAWIRGCAGDLAGDAELSDEVLRRATEAGAVSAAVQAAGTCAYALGATGRFAESGERFARALRLAEEAGNTYRVAWAYAQQALVLGLAGRPRDGVSCAQRALETDPMAPDAVALEDLAHNLWLVGRLEDAVEVLQRSAARRPLRGSRRRAWGAALAARIYGEMGQAGRARRTLDMVAETYGDAPMLTWGCWPPWTEGLLVWQDGDADAAQRVLEETAHRVREIGAAPYEALILNDLIEVCADAGASEKVGEVGARLEAIADGVGGGLVLALAGLAAAWRDLLGGDHEDAAIGASTAAESFSEHGYELHRATALGVAGRARRNGGGDGVALLTEAARIQDRCGAVWRRDRTLAELRRWGSRGQRAVAAVQGPGSLTGREREVAELAAHGHTAREIGERLFISPRTVETHLANSYAKLGVASKRELIRRADQLGLRSTRP